MTQTSRGSPGEEVQSLAECGSVWGCPQDLPSIALEARAGSLLAIRRAPAHLDAPMPKGRPGLLPGTVGHTCGSSGYQEGRGQSSLSTLPMIFSSKTGRMASSSRTSSNTTPQSNSSLTFLK